MTVGEFKSALDSLSEDQFQQFRQSWGGAHASRAEAVQEFAYAPNPAQYERIIIFRLHPFGLDLRAEDEKLVAAAVESAQAAKVSADASMLSAQSARDSVRWARWAVVVAVMAALAGVFVGVLTR